MLGLEYIYLIQLELRILGNRLIKIYVGVFLNKQNCTVFGNMVMLKVNADSNNVARHRHAILLNKYSKENKYQTRMIHVLQLHLHSSTTFLSLKSVPKIPSPTAGVNFPYGGMEEIT